MAPPNENHYGSLPSASTHSQSTSSSYNRLENGEIASEKAALLVEKTPSSKPSSDFGASKKKSNRHLPTKWLLVIIVVICGVKLMNIVERRWNTFEEPHDSHLDPNYRQGPLSLLDPVIDLGMFAFDRPLASQPTVHRSLEAPNRGRALPTNAWYQSFLLLSDDGDKPPSVMHRAYSVPYIVDAAGPIAGLRVYPHHVGATSNVIQTYTIENQGLTLGLATSDGASAPPRYQVEQMTPLGITLSWVCFECWLVFFAT